MLAIVRGQCASKNLVGGAFALALFVFWLLPGVAQAATELQYDGGYTYSLVSQTLTKAQSPYIIHAGCFGATKIPAGVTVTVEAGVIIKFGVESGCGGGAGHLGVYGNFFVNGTLEEPVIFTSIYDDSVGGDTNGDGGATTPRPGIWNDIEIGTYIAGATNVVSIKNAVFRYGGVRGAMVDVWSAVGSLTFENLEMAYSAGFGLTSQRSFTIVSSSFHDNLSGAINADSLWAPQVDARNNWWGDASGPSVAGNPTGRGQTFRGNVLYDPWIGKPPANTAPELRFVASGGFDDGVEPNTSFLPGQKPVFQVEYKDAENQAPGEIKVVVGSTSYPLSVLPGQDGNYANGEMFGFTGPTSTFPKGTYSFHFEASDGALTTRLPASGELVFTIKLESVILIPGILGTEMKRGDEVLWMDAPRLIGSPSDEFMDPLTMDENGQPIDSLVFKDDILRNVFGGGFDYSQGLIAALQSNTYQENADLFVFPYDWRFSNIITAQKLNEKIDAVIAQTGSQKVNLVAHSMGGLVVKQYIVNDGSSKVNKLIFVGTPHLGAPKAFKNLLVGDNFNMPFILNPSEMKKLSQNMPSAYELLPSQTFFNRFGGYFINFTPQPVGYSETNNFLLSHNVNAGLLQARESFHTSALDNFNAPGASIFNISGCNSYTLGRLARRNIFLEGGVAAEEYDIDEVAGDGTVTLPSAIAVSGAKQFFATEVDHAKMLSQEGPRDLIVQILTDTVNSAALPAHIQADPGGNCHLKNGKLISVHSPVDLHVYDSQGNHVGPAAGGVIDQNIPGAVYENIANNKFIFVPEDAGQTYTVKLDATATGTFSLRVSNIDGETRTQTTFFSDIPVVPSSQAEMIVSDTSADTALQFDSRGTNTFVPVPASATLTATEQADFSAPTTTVELQGTLGQLGWYVSPVVVSLPAFDNTAGILRTEYSLDSGATWREYAGPFTVFQAGSTTVLYKSIDRAGNREQQKQSTFQIDSTAPVTVARIEGQSGQSGWYVSPVTVNFSATDTPAGVERTEYSLDNGSTWQTYQAPFQVGKEGTTTLLFRSTDTAGNRENVKQKEILIDTSPSLSAASFQGRAGRYGWYLSAVTTTLAASDAVSGVNKIEYSLDSGVTWQIYSASFLVDKEGVTTLFYRSTDTAGNVGTTQQQQIKIDRTVPEAAIVFDPIKKDIVISSPSPATVIDKKEMVRVEDPAGNMLELYFTEEDRRRSMRAEIEKILYNGRELQPTADNHFSFVWNQDRFGRLTRLIQTVTVRGQIRLVAVYDKQRNETYVTGQDVAIGRVRARYRGLFLIKIITHEGRVGYKI